jgi:hypothetical protein
MNLLAMSKDKEKTLIETITNKVKSIFADEPKAEETKENLMVEAVVKDTGITISAESWEVGQTVNTITEEGDTIAIPEGTYELEDGTILTVDADGVILEIVTEEVEEVEEVEAEKKEEEMSTEKKEPVYVTEEQLSAAMAPVLQALEKVAVKMSSMEPKEKKEEADTDKVQAENKLLKQRLSEKRKSIKLEKEKSETTVDPLGKVKNRGHVNGVRQRVMKNFEDFDFTIQKSSEPIDLN